MKEINGKCKSCLGCNRLENPNFEGCNECVHYAKRRRFGFHQFIQRVNTHINFAGFVRSLYRYKRNFTIFIRDCGDLFRRVPRAALLIIRRQCKLRALKHFVLTILVHFVERQLAIFRANRAATC